MAAASSHERNELESMSRKNLQAVAKEYGIAANLGSKVIIEKILETELLEGDEDDEESQDFRQIKEHFAMCRSYLAAVNHRMEIIGANCSEKFLDCVMKRYRDEQSYLATELSQLTLVKAVVQGKKLLASTAKPAGITVEGSSKALVSSEAEFQGKIESTKLAGIVVEGPGKALVSSEAEFQDKTAEAAASTAKSVVIGEPVKRGGKIVQWVGKVLSIEDKKGFIDGRSEHGGRDERCFFYPQDLLHTLKKGDQVRFHVDVTAKRRDHHHLKACKVVKEEANPQQARTKKSSGLYSQVVKTADARRMQSMETTIYELRRLLDASYRPQALNGSRKWRGGWRW
jgi:hypothetical protein